MKKTPHWAKFHVSITHIDGTSSYYFQSLKGAQTKFERHFSNPIVNHVSAQFEGIDEKTWSLESHLLRHHYLRIIDHFGGVVVIEQV